MVFLMQRYDVIVCILSKNCTTFCFKEMMGRGSVFSGEKKVKEEISYFNDFLLLKMAAYIRLRVSMGST